MRYHPCTFYSVFTGSLFFLLPLPVNDFINTKPHLENEAEILAINLKDKTLKCTVVDKNSQKKTISM